eukprot:9492768-Pyramimonas_sp.AAC.1
MRTLRYAPWRYSSNLEHARAWCRFFSTSAILTSDAMRARSASSARCWEGAFAREETTDARDCALSYGRLERMWMMFPWYTSDAYVIHTRALPTSLSSLCFGDDGVVIVKNAYAVPHNESAGQMQPPPCNRWTWRESGFIFCVVKLLLVESRAAVWCADRDRNLDIGFRFFTCADPIKNGSRFSSLRMSLGIKVAVDIDFHRTMFELHHRVNPKEVIVGWYSTGGDVMNSDALIQDFYSGQTPHPIHLTVDTNMNLDTIGVKQVLLSDVINDTRGCMCDPRALTVLPMTNTTSMNHSVIGFDDPRYICRLSE